MTGQVEVRHPPGRAEERRYAFDVVLGEMLGVPYRAAAEQRDDVLITVPGAAGAVTLADGLLGVPDEAWLTDRALPAAPLHRLDGLPVLYGTAEAASTSPEAIALPVDVFGGVFFLLTRYEEVVRRDERDEHERFSPNASLAASEDFLDRPLVDEYVGLLAEALDAMWPGLGRVARAPALRVSHDVDWPRNPRPGALPTARAVAGDLVRRRDPVLAADRARAAVRGGADLYDTFDFLMRASEERGLRSAFYVMAGVSRPGIDGGYALDDPFVEGLLTRIHERGHEIGLHPSYETFRSPDLVAQEFAALRATCERLGIEQETWGGRQHYLRWECPTTWRAWEAAGLDYDSSVGFARRAGFRAGTARDHPVFDVAAGRRLSLRERPLVVMEAALLRDPAVRDDDVPRRVAALAAASARHGGDLTLLWHNSSLISRRQRRLYARTLDASLTELRR